MAFLRDIDRWFIEEILPHEPIFLARAHRFTANREDAADLVQDTYVKLYGLDTWRTLADPRAYTLTMVRNLAIQRLRHARVVDIRHVARLDALELSDDAPDAQREVIGREQLRRLLKAVDRLPERCRQMIILRRFEERTPMEISRLLGLSLSTLEKRLSRGMRLLVEAMDAEPMSARDLEDGRTQSEQPAPRSNRR